MQKRLLPLKAVTKIIIIPFTSSSRQQSCVPATYGIYYCTHTYSYIHITEHHSNIKLIARKYKDSQAYFQFTVLDLFTLKMQVWHDTITCKQNAETAFAAESRD